MSGKPKYTQSQQNVIDYRGNRMLVSASAGTGKTTVMIERIVSLIQEGVDVSQIVVVTFTNMAAAEMKNRLAVKLSEKSDNPKVLEHIEKLDTASICTLHSFCSELLRNYFYVVDIDPAFSILDNATVATLRSNALDETFGYYFERKDDVFRRTYKIFSTARKEENFKSALMRLYEFSRRISGFSDWYQSKRANFTELSDDNPVIVTLLNDVKQNVEYYRRNLLSIADRCADEGLTFEETVRSNAQQFARIRFTDLQTALNDLWKVNLLSIPRYNKKTATVAEDSIRSDYKSLAGDFKKFADNYASLSRGRTLEELWSETESAVQYTDKLVEIIAKFDEIFFEMKKQRGGLDFNDLEQLTLKVLSDAETLAQIRERYRYVFVDEYQDTNPVQEEIVSALSADGNLFMVGDVKQSIYGFRGCEPSIFVDKYNRYKQDNVGRVEELNDNFRSNVQILDFVNDVFDCIMTESFGKVDYANTSRLRGVKPPVLKTASTKIDFVMQSEREETEYDGVYDITAPAEESNYIRQGELIARNIRQYVGMAYKDADGTTRRISYGDIVILMRSLTNKATDIYNALVKCGIPVLANFRADELDSKEIKDFVNLLRVIDNPYNDIYVIGVCLSSFGGFDEAELGHIRLDTEGRIPFYSRLVNYLTEGANAAIKQKITQLLRFIDDIRFYSRSATVSEIALRVIREKHYDLYVQGLPNGSLRLRKLYGFIDRVKGAAYADSVDKFLAYLDESPDNRAEEAPGETNAVRLMTMHASKGLEFPVVIIAGVETQFRFDPQSVETNIDMGLAVKYYNFDTMKVANTLGVAACGMFNKTKQREEEMRLLYVAMTRAKYALNIVGTVGEKQLQALPKLPTRAMSHLDWLLSALRSRYSDEEYQTARNVEIRIVTELERGESAQKDNLLCEQRTDRENILAAINAEYAYKAQTEMPLKIVSSALDKQYLDGDNDDERAEQYVTPLNPNANRSEIGTAYHKVLQYAPNLANTYEILQTIATLKENNQIDRQFANEIDVDKVYAALHNPQFAKLLQSGQIFREIPFMLYAPYNQVVPQGKFSDDVILQGVIDLLVIDGNKATVVDYKYTSRSGKVKDKYRVQLNSYKLAVERICGITDVACYVLSIDDNKLIKMD